MKKLMILTFALSALFTTNALADSNSEGAAEEVKSHKAEIVNLTSCSLSGIIVDTENEETLAGATITVDGKKYYSDLDGRFNISTLKPGKHTISVDLISYEPSQAEVEVVKKEENLLVRLVQR